jgi:putative nucleotidyltransferase with HDIG domain
LLRLTNDDQVSMRQLSLLIASEPAFSSEVLTIANSALYPSRVPITSVLQAVVVLGTNALRGICLTVGVRSYLGESLNHESLRALWRHNMACALVARQLATASLMDPNTAYTAGIMHDIGRLGLAVIAPKRYAILIENFRGTPSSILELEQERFGFHHCEVGQRLVKDWKLPPEFEPIVAHHHAPRQRQDEWNLPGLINVSCRLADTAGFAAFQGCEITPFADLLNELPDREQKTFDSGLEELSFELSRQINAVESL